jgi:hypothetical protein
MGDCDLQLATSNIQNGGNRQLTSWAIVTRLKVWLIYT